MDALKRMQTAHVTLGLAIGSVLSQELTGLAQKVLSGPAVPSAVTMLAIVISVFSMRYIVLTLFNKQRWFRRFMLGSQYVEGIWFDLMRRKDGLIVELGVSRLSYCDAEIRYSGDDYDLSMNHTAPYYTEVANLKWDGQRLKLMYKYHAERSDEKDVGTVGYGELQFSPPGQRPNHYTGCYFVLETAQKYSFEGNRLDEKNDREIISLLERGDTKREALCQLLDRFGTDTDRKMMQLIRQGKTRDEAMKLVMERNPH